MIRLGIRLVKLGLIATVLVLSLRGMIGLLAAAG